MVPLFTVQRLTPRFAQSANIRFRERRAVRAPDLLAVREDVRLKHGVGRARAAQRVRAVPPVKVYVGGQQPGMAVKAPSNVLSAEIEVAGKEVPLSAC